MFLVGLVFLIVVIGAVVIGGAMALGFDIVFAVRRFAAASGLIAHIPERLAGQTGTFLEYPRIRQVRRSADCCEFILYPAPGSTVQDWIDETDALATFMHAAEAVITPVGVGDHARVAVNYADTIPEKFGVVDFLRGEDDGGR